MSLSVTWEIVFFYARGFFFARQREKQKTKKWSFFLGFFLCFFLCFVVFLGRFVLLVFFVVFRASARRNFELFFRRWHEQNREFPLCSSRSAICRATSRFGHFLVAISAPRARTPRQKNDLGELYMTQTRPRSRKGYVGSFVGARSKTTTRGVPSARRSPGCPMERRAPRRPRAPRLLVPFRHVFRPTASQTRPCR